MDLTMQDAGAGRFAFGEVRDMSYAQAAAMAVTRESTSISRVTAMAAACA